MRTHRGRYVIAGPRSVVWSPEPDTEPRYAAEVSNKKQMRELECTLIAEDYLLRKRSSYFAPTKWWDRESLTCGDVGVAATLRC